MYALQYDGDECLVWPYGCSTQGAGAINIDRVSHAVHRLVCEAVNGPPPSTGHMAVRECGTTKCIAPRHVKWMTHAEKARCVARRNAGKGPRLKLTDDKVRDIWRRICANETPAEIAAAYDVGRSTISEIKHGLRWQHVTGHERKTEHA